ncbi:HPP family protein [Erythrobacter sp. SG61-1L]|uniref:HPP family protein n=1 Tax=Erythrobacter sp. SG61-1L TaxID=1603897 RepID=UPI0006C90F9E|nr:HPP family protein [Erythrobacter sp. SG61-1L]
MLSQILRSTAALGRQPALGHLGWLRGALGAALGIFLAGAATFAIVRLAGGIADMGTLPWLVAPLGASAVLVFCVPASPLAQPWPVIGGDLLSALVGLAAGHLFGTPWIAAGTAVGTAIAVMTLTRCLHPPGGACALLCALGATGPEHWGYAHMIPIAANVGVLVLVGWLYNNLTGHAWPHVMPTPPAPANAALYQREDLDAVLEEWDELLDVDADDLDALFQAVERHARNRAAQGKSRR